MTDAEFIAWLKSPSRVSCVLVEAVARVAGVETTRYLSNRGYVTGPSDTPANQPYTDGTISGGGTITEQLSLDGSGPGMSFGDIEIDNTDGTLDGWLSDVWTNRSVKMFVGDMRWARADFRLVFDGIAADLTSSARDVLNLTMRDKLQRLNTSISEATLGGTSANADRLLPIVLGEVHNLTPLLADKATLTYQIHNGVTERLIEVRDEGVPVSHDTDLITGTFQPWATPAGTLTVSVQGAKLAGTYVNTAAKLVQLLATQYGTDPFSSGDLDAVSLAAFDASNPQPLGRPVVDRENVLAVAQELAASIGAQVIVSATGLLQLIKIALPATGTPTAVTASNMAEKSLSIVQRVPVIASVKLGYCRNWTVQPNLQTGIPTEDKDLFAQEWLTSTASDSGVASTYKLSQQATQIDTLLLTKADADAESARRLALWKVPRTVFQYVGEPELMLEPLGGYQTLTHPRFSLGSGVDAQIVSVTRDWRAPSVTFQVLA
jgi:hypothetical protein